MPVGSISILLSVLSVTNGNALVPPGLFFLLCIFKIRVARAASLLYYFLRVWQSCSDFALQQQSGKSGLISKWMVSECGVVSL